jgi:hypothetical protein
MTLAGVLFALGVAAFAAAAAFFAKGVAASWSDPEFAPHRSSLIWSYPAAVRRAPAAARIHFKRCYLALAAFIAICVAGVLAGFAAASS